MKKQTFFNQTSENTKRFGNQRDGEKNTCNRFVVVRNFEWRKFRIDTRTRYVRVAGSLVIRTHRSMFIINSKCLWSLASLFGRSLRGDFQRGFVVNNNVKWLG